MPWAALAAAAVGAGASLYGSKKSADRAKDIADQADPYAIADANFRTNNVNRYTPFGSVEYNVNRGNPKDPTDDTYSMRQSYSPQMQQLADAMLGVAGRAPAQIQSTMPSGLRNIMGEVYGGDVPGFEYSAPTYGFGQDRRPGAGQVMEDFNWKNYDEDGNKVGDAPYQPWVEGQGNFVGSDGKLAITPGETTNRQILDQLYNAGHISDYDYNTMLESFETSGSGVNTGWSFGKPASEMIGWLPDNLHPRFRAANERIFNAIAQMNPNTQAASQEQTEPDVSAYDQQSLQALIQAMTAQGGV